MEFSRPDTGVGCHSLLPRIFPTQGSNYGLLYCRQTLYQLNHQGIPHQSISQFSCSVMSNSLQPHGLQHARPPCLLPTPGVYSNSCPLSWWCHPTISSSVIPFSSCLQSFPASGSFPMCPIFTSGGKVLELQVSISPSNEYSGLISFRVEWLDLLTDQGTLKSLLQHHSSKHQFFGAQLSL